MILIYHSKIFTWPTHPWPYPVHPRILAEEFEKREQLERLKEEQGAQLREERKRRENLEDLRELHQAEIREERRKLEALHQEREAADAKLQVG